MTGGPGRGLKPLTAALALLGLAALAAPAAPGLPGEPGAARAAAAPTAATPPVADYLASLYFDGPDGRDGGERVFPVANSGPAPEGGPPAHFFPLDQDGNGDGFVGVEDALENMVPYAIGPAGGTGRTGLPERGPNDQRPAVYVHTVSLDGGWDGWAAHQYWLYYADNDWLNHHEHDWEWYSVYFEGGRPRTVRLSFHGGSFAYEWQALEEAGLVEDGTHLRLSVDRGSHAFLSPTAPLQDGVRIGWDGTVSARGGRLDAGDGSTFPWVVLEGGRSPDFYAFGDPFYLDGELEDLRPAPWARPEWTDPPPPYGFRAGGDGDGRQSFLDVPSDHPQAAAVATLHEAGVVEGYPVPGGALFRPEEALLRAQLLKMVCGVLGLTLTSEPAPFTDLGPADPRDPYPHQFAAAAARAGLVRGIGDGRLRPYEPVLRRHLHLILERAGAPRAGDAAADPWGPVSRAEAAAALAPLLAFPAGLPIMR